FSSATCQLWFEIAVEMIDVGSLRLEFPRNLGSGQAPGIQDGAVTRPDRHVRTAAARHGIAVRRGEPHRLPACDHAVFPAIRAADTDIRPVVTGILSIETVNIHDPLSIRRPVGSEVEMLGFSGKTDAVRSVDVAGPDLITLRAGQMEGHSPSVRAEAQA